MRPPDDLNTLKHVPLAMLGAGLFVVPFMWAFVLEKPTLLAMAPASGIVFLLTGLYIKYRSRYSPRDALWAFPLALVFFGSLLVASTTALAWRMNRPDLYGMAIGIAVLLACGGLAVGYWSERRRLAALTQDGVPELLAPLLDLQRHRVRPADAGAAQASLGRLAFATALALNVPLLLQLGGWDRNDVVWLAMPLLGGAVTYVLVTGFGPALARALAVVALEERMDRRFFTSRLEELQQLRRGFGLSRWLCRPEDRPVAKSTKSGAGSSRQRP